LTFAILIYNFFLYILSYYIVLSLSNISMIYVFSYDIIDFRLCNKFYIRMFFTDLNNTKQAKH